MTVLSNSFIASGEPTVTEAVNYSDRKLWLRTIHEASEALIDGKTWKSYIKASIED